MVCYLLISLLFTLLNPVMAKEFINPITIYEIGYFHNIKNFDHPKKDTPSKAREFTDLETYCGPPKSFINQYDRLKYRLYMCGDKHFALKEDDFKVAKKLHELKKKASTPSPDPSVHQTKPSPVKKNINPQPIPQQEKNILPDNLQKIITLQGNVKLYPVRLNKGTNDYQFSSKDNFLYKNRGQFLQIHKALKGDNGPYLVVTLPNYPGEFVIQEQELTRAIKGKSKIFSPVMGISAKAKPDGFNFELDSSRKNIMIKPDTEVIIERILENKTGKYYVLNFPDQTDLTTYIVSETDFNNSTQGLSKLKTPLEISQAIESKNNSYTINSRAPSIILPTNTLVSVEDRISGNSEDFFILTIKGRPEKYVVPVTDFENSLLGNLEEEEDDEDEANTLDQSKIKEELASLRKQILSTYKIETDIDQIKVIKPFLATPSKLDGTNIAPQAKATPIHINSNIKLLPPKNGRVLFSYNGNTYSMAPHIALQALDDFDPKYMPKNIKPVTIKPDQVKTTVQPNEQEIITIEKTKGKRKIEIAITRNKGEKFAILREMGDLRLEIPVAPSGPYRKIVDNSPYTKKTLNDMAKDQYDLLIETTQKYPGLIDSTELEKLARTDYGRCVSASIEHSTSLNRFFYCDSEKAKPILSTTRPQVTPELKAAIAGEFIMIHKCLPLKEKEMLPIAFHESRFFPNAVSFTGVVGIGQVTKKAAKDVERVMLPKLANLITNKPECKYLLDIKNNPKLRLKTGKSCAQQFDPYNIRLSILYASLYYLYLQEDAKVRVMERYKGKLPSDEIMESCVDVYSACSFNTGICMVKQLNDFLIKTLPAPNHDTNDFFKGYYERLREEGALYVPKIYSDLDKMQKSANLSCAPTKAQ